jgi:hypothetical protein
MGFKKQLLMGVGPNGRADRLAGIQYDAVLESNRLLAQQNEILRAQLEYQSKILFDIYSLLRSSHQGQ